VKNITLNAGGVIGALLCGALVAAYLVMTKDFDKNAKLIVIGVIAGAFAGNFGWGLIFKKKQD
jgi:hypothetical protein